MSSFDVQTATELKDEILDALRLLLPRLDTAVFSDAALKAMAMGHVLEGLSKFIDWTADQVFPDSATEENLLRHAALHGVSRKAATVAEGTAAFTGVDGTPIPVGSTFRANNGWIYETTAAAVWDGGGNATVAAEAQTAGADGNLTAGATLTLDPSIPNIDSVGEADTNFTGGTDVETMAALLARLLDHLQQPPAGGTANDWEQWTLEVDGVTEAYCFPLRRGLGTADVVPFTTGAGGGRAVPGAGLISDIEDYLETVRPVTVASYEVVQADEVSVNVSVTNVVVDPDYDEATVLAAIETSVEALFPELPPGETLYLSTQLRPAISGVAGVVDYTLAAPVANVTTTVSETSVEVLIAGTVTATA